jgi:hypothetical protein
MNYPNCEDSAELNGNWPSRRHGDGAPAMRMSAADLAAVAGVLAEVHSLLSRDPKTALDNWSLLDRVIRAKLAAVAALGAGSVEITQDREV